jgi:hypothetical protein
MTPVLILAIIVAVAIAYNRIEAARQQEALKGFFANLTDPVIVTALHPYDRTVSERAQWYRDAIKESGNKWKPPVLEFPYSGSYDIPGQSGSFIGMTFAQYQAKCFEIYLLELQRWQAQVQRATGLNTMNQTIANQRPGDAFSWS